MLLEGLWAIIRPYRRDVTKPTVKATRVLRQTLGVASRIVAMEGLGDANLGHISARAGGRQTFWIKRAGIGLEEVRPSDLVMVNFDGRKLAGRGQLHLETPLHSEIYRARPDVGSIVHTHSLCATLIGCAGKPVRPITHEGTLFVDAPVFNDTTSIISTPALGRAVARALGSQRALFLRNHGVVVVGKDPEEACVLILLLERACRIQLLASSLGDYNWSKANEAAVKRRQIYPSQALRSMWEYYVRKLKRQERNGQ